MILRPVLLEDADQLERLVAHLGFGMGAGFRTNRNGLEGKIECSLQSFKGQISNHEHQYLFVLENSAGQLIGMCGLETVNRGQPFHTFRLHTEQIESKPLQIRRDLTVLHLVETLTGATSLCSQFVLPAYRRKGLGKLLTVGRLLYMANCRHKFNSPILVELRGAYDEKGYNRFWRWVGQPFFRQMDYSTYVQLLHAGLETELLNLLPKHPIYLSLMPPEAQTELQQIHPETLPNYKLCQAQGFRFSHHLGYSSGAPILQAELAQIYTLRKNQTAWLSQSIPACQSKLCSPKSQKKELHKPETQNHGLHIIGNLHMDLEFRVCQGIVAATGSDQIVASPVVARALNVKYDQVRYVRLP